MRTDHGRERCNWPFVKPGTEILLKAREGRRRLQGIAVSVDGRHVHERDAIVESEGLLANVCDVMSCQLGEHR